MSLDQRRERSSIPRAQANEEAGIGLTDGLGRRRHPWVGAIMALPAVREGP